MIEKEEREGEGRGRRREKAWSDIMYQCVCKRGR